MPSIKNIVEVIFFSSNKSLSKKDIAKLFDFDFDFENIVLDLNKEYESNNKGYTIVKIANGYRMQTKSEYHDYISKLNSIKKKITLSNSALEVLAIISYKQPISKVKIDGLRGINSNSVIKTLLKNDLITIKGRDNEFGRSILYGTTVTFLQIFGLEDINDLPSADEINTIMKSDET